MSMNFLNLYNSINQKNNIKIFNYNSLQDILDIRLITKNQKIFSDNILYIGNSSDINLSMLSSKCFYVIVDSNKNNLENIKFEDFNIILLSDNIDLFLLFNEIQDIYNEELKIMKNSAILLNSLIQGKGLNYLINISSKILNNPLIFIDASFKIISYSSTYEITDKLWNENIHAGYCSYEFINEVKKLKSVKNSPNNNEPYIVTCDKSPIRRLVSKVFIKNSLVGYIIVLESFTLFENKNENLLPIISNVISEELLTNKFFNKSKGAVYESFFLELLENNIKDERIKQERLKSINFNYNNSLYVFVIDISNYKTNNSSDFLRNSLENLFPNSKSLFYKDNIILISESNKNNEISKSKIDKFILFAKKENLISGISESFDNILDFKKYYIQALNALNIGKKLSLNDSIFFYDDLRFFDLISEFHNKNEMLKFCTPNVLKLKEYDEKHNKDYFNTLYNYLKHNQNINLTSKSLFIHRNTISYRINKIEEILDMDLKDGENIFKVNYSMKIIKYLSVS
ncbi:helix-turn-helix domain-containing protein [Clostridium sp. D2Q-11]|uniref:Helix-turn-helix domain-containing protein n=1 Tax=Anaeromonas frigoriresistens TaxID=2683708 RepID=A0A942URS9_9FIRM|nr:helix-turn-helix domain-containing protein [Anaeromonas frigoriresistens]MBS4538064.1 helix-turn-helix domain-containing protein [Anaeromonas frigoriresistens]